MVKMESYWCENKPTLDDIKFAYERVNQGVTVEIRWFVSYSGQYNRIIIANSLERYPKPEDLFEACIPKRYPV